MYGLGYKYTKQWSTILDILRMFNIKHTLLLMRLLIDNIFLEKSFPLYREAQLRQQTSAYPDDYIWIKIM